LTDTTNGVFDVSLPDGLEYTIFAQCESDVALLDGVMPTNEPVALELAPGQALSAELRGFPDVYAIASRSGLSLSGWIAQGENLLLDLVPSGTYELRLLSYERFHAYFFRRAPNSAPLGESTLWESEVVAGARGVVLRDR